MADTVSFEKFYNIVKNENIIAKGLATERDLDEAAIAANKAFKAWSKLPLQTRAMETFADGLEKHKGDLADLLHKEIGKPTVVQVLGGDDNLGPWITKHPDIAKISFTGSIATGKKIMAAAADTLNTVNLELGGNDAAVVCMVTKHIYVHESVFDEFIIHFTAIVKRYRVGEGFCSPIQNKAQYEKVKSIFQDCEEQQYEFAVDYGKISTDEHQTGYIIAPAVISKPPENSRIVQEEPFGPILPVLTWREDEEAIERANNTSTGLGAIIYCRDEKRAWHIAESLETGSVWVNGGLKLDPIALLERTSREALAESGSARAHILH
ncbi:putative betaine aldehyde dehydrogenase, chloroplastic [Lipomyces tetrasporus]